VIDDGSKVNLKIMQLMSCILCHFGGNILNHCSSSGWLGIISYDKGHGTISMKRHVSVHNLQELAKWHVGIKQNKVLDGEHLAIKKKTCPSPSFIMEFLVQQSHINKMTLRNKHS
jgi:hypothetical protein